MDFYINFIRACFEIVNWLTIIVNGIDFSTISLSLLFLDNPRPLKHLCRLKIRKLLGLRRLQKLSSMKKFQLPPVLKNYILYKEYDLYGKGIHLE